MIFFAWPKVGPIAPPAALGRSSAARRDCTLGFRLALAPAPAP